MLSMGMKTKRAIDDLAYKIIGCAIEVHKELGPGLLEAIYEKCFIEELLSKGLRVESQKKVPVFYKGKALDYDLRLDILVEDCIVVELKAVEVVHPVCQAQLLTYLKLLKKPKGLLINFHCDNIVSNLVSMVTEEYAMLPDR